jgi:hypothetical protein
LESNGASGNNNLGIASSAAAATWLGTQFGAIKDWLGGLILNNDSSSATGDADKQSPPLPEFDHSDPTKAPKNQDGTEWNWHGPDDPGGERGAYVNPGDPDQSLHPDLDHGGDIGPHWDLTDRNVGSWRIYPDGRIEPK